MTIPLDVLNKDTLSSRVRSLPETCVVKSLHQLSSGVESGGMEPVAGQSGSVGTDLEAVACGCACGHRRR